MGGIPWSIEEDNLLKKRYPFEGSSQSLIKTLGRTYRAIKSRVRVLNLVWSRKPKWTKEEDVVLRNEFANADQKILSEKLGRSIMAVQLRAYRLGLKISSEKERQNRFNATRGRFTGRIGSASQAFKGYGKVFATYISNVRRNAIKRNIPYPLLYPTLGNYQYLNSLITDICPLSGRALIYPSRCRDLKANASLDRINSSGGYERGNVRWVHRTVNIMRNAMTDEVFIGWIRDIEKTTRVL